MLIIIAILMVLLICYSIIPTVLIRISGWGITKKINGRNGIALTFDDGPNPKYTPQLLDLLKKYDVKATFFVVGSKAKRYPEIIKRMHQEGHTIGNHHFDHLSSWGLSPNNLRKQLSLTNKVITECTKEDVFFYRPPWGRFNIFTLLLSKKYHVIMWSGIFGDWKIGSCKTNLLSQLRKSTVNGSIFLLHDCGETRGADIEAPKYMIEQLELYLQEIKKSGTQFINLKDIFPITRGYYDYPNDINLY